MTESQRPFDQRNYAFELGAIHGKLEALGAGQDEICRRLDVDVKARLDKVNGSIATLYQRTDDNKAALLNHVIECPQKEKIERLSEKLGAIERKISDQLASSNTSSTWREKLLYPLIRIIGTGIALLFLYHAQELLKQTIR